MRAQWALATATLVPGLAAAGALLFTAISVQQAQDNLNVTQQGQITDRYNDAITNLGSESEDVRLGGIYALRRIMNDSPRDHPHIVSVLVAYTRGHASEPGPIRADTRPANDIRAALGVLRDRDPDLDSTRFRLDLANTFLPNADLYRVTLDGADLHKAALPYANLESASLSSANLSGTNLTDAKLPSALKDADLEGADLDKAELVGADLTGARLLRAQLNYADLQYANLTGAKMAFANLKYADLHGAILTRANVSGADLADVDLSGADLRGAYLLAARGLTVEQVLQGKLSADTRLPPDLVSDPRVRARIKPGAPVH
ncbi:pentapeptide repeat-containing protein [Streptomyces sp. NPDC055287]